MEATSHIEITPGVCSGRPRIAGTRIRVQNVVLWSEQGVSPDEIVASYPQLTLADVHAALAFYFDHREEMDQLIREDAAYVEAMKARFNSPPVLPSTQAPLSGGNPVSP